MFAGELGPVIKELTQYPVAFLGGFFSGIFRIELSDDPVKSWLEQQGATSGDRHDDNSNGNGSRGPQSISIE